MTDATDRRRAGFKRRTRLANARDRLADVVAPHGRIERAPPAEADGRTLADAVVAAHDVPHYRRSAVDGYAVRAADTFGAGDRSPVVLRRTARDGEPTEVEPESAVRVHTGSVVPEGADAVVMVEHVEAFGPELEVFDAVAAGENVDAVGDDVREGQRLYDAGHRLRPSDLGLLRSVGVHEVPVASRPDVAVVPTGGELVQGDPGPGEVVETNGLTTAGLVERWGGSARYRSVVADDRDAIRAAVERDLDADLLVTTGGSSVGERDLVPDVVAELGEVFVHGVALKPGHPVALGRVGGTPVVMLPGLPVACIVNAVQFVRPAVRWLEGSAVEEPPTVEARLTRKLRSEPGVRTFARVELGEDEGERTATPVSAGGAGLLSSVALADGWVVVPEESEGIPVDATVHVENWEWSA